jgi:hypothetical protein
MTPVVFSDGLDPGPLSPKKINPCEKEQDAIIYLPTSASATESQAHDGEDTGQREQNHLNLLFPKISMHRGAIWNLILAV